MTLLERSLQLQALTEYAADAARAEGRLVLISGEAGVGKTALVEALEEREPDAVWAWGACDGLFTPRPLGPLLDLAAALGGGISEAVHDGRPREEIFRTLLTDLAACSPYAAVVVEDVHWADEATLDLLRFLGRRIRHTPVLLAVTYRDDEVPPGHPLRRCLAQLAMERSTRRVDVPTLTPAAVRELARGSGLAVDLLQDLTGGNPFFLTEVLASGDATTLPSSARDAVLGRVETLGRPARRVLEAASLLGRTVDVDLVERLVEATADTWDELVDSGLLVADGGRLRFRHEITRLAVEGTVPPHRAAPLHARALAALTARGDVDDARLAHHAEGAADGSAVRRYAVAAAERASALAAHREAALQYERAVRWSAGDEQPTLADLNDRLATEYGLLDRWTEATQAREAALELWRGIGDRRREAMSLCQLSVCHWRECRGAEARQALEDALAILGPLGDSEDLARVVARRAAQHMVDGEYPAGLARADQAVALARDLGLPAVLSDALNTRAAILQSGEGGGDWLPAMRTSLEVALAAGAHEAAGRAYTNLHAGSLASLMLAEADRVYREGLEYCEVHDLGTWGNCVASERVTWLELTGRWDEAIGAGRARIALTHLSPVNRLGTWITLGRILARRGDPECWRHLDTALQQAVRLDEPQYLVPIHLARAEAAWLEQRTDEAVEAVEAARGLAQGVDRWLRGQVAVWAARLGLEPVPGVLGEPYASQARGDVAAAVAGFDEAQASYDAALALADGPDQDQWRAALDRLETLGATATAHVVRRRLRAAGARSVPSGARASTRAHPAGLTRREHEVLRELATGSTNEEIAARLFISPKTVDHHVSAVLGKLGVGSRRDAASEARRRGLLTSPAQSG